MRVAAVKSILNKVVNPYGFGWLLKTWLGRNKFREGEEWDEQVHVFNELSVPP